LRYEGCGDRRCRLRGSHLTEYLISQGHEVVVLDNLSTGRLSNLHRVANSGDLRVVQGDICDRSVVEDTVAGSDVAFTWRPRWVRS
jgi:UDP-glucose 4-epimerase